MDKQIFMVIIAFIFSNLLNAQVSNKTVEEQFSPKYHFYPSGDPTGLYYFNGYYYNNWGIAKSKDFVHWKFTPYGEKRKSLREVWRNANLSEREKDSLLNTVTRLGGSGSIVYDKFNTSGLGSKNNPPFVSLWHNQIEPWNNQVIGIAYSLDSVSSWTRYDKFPVLDINSREFRDPKVFWYEPTKKWIMVIGLADAPKIKFFESENLKDWAFLSDFGPRGAVAGVWECADLFQLPVDGDPNNAKWVLSISVQPLSGQYFIGDFDGTRFTLDRQFEKSLDSINNIVDGEVIFDFEKGLDDWEMEGDAFIESPADRALYYQSAVMGYEGHFFVNSFHHQERATGKITSPQFKISKKYINFLVGGGYYPGEESVNLLVNGEIVRSQSGNHSGGLQWKSWDVSEYLDKNARITISDQKKDEAGYIYVDQIMQSDIKAEREREGAFWFDYGPDFFAARTWNNYAQSENRKIWTGWMGSWRYAGSEPIRGIQAVPRSLKLKTFPKGVRLIQEPIEELKTLRKKTLHSKNKNFEGSWVPEKIQPSENVYELIVEIENVDAKDFGIKLAIGKNQQTTIGYSVGAQELYVDRRQSGLKDFSDLFPQLSKGPMRNEKITKFQIFVDKSSIEVFGNNGETVISSKIYPNNDSVGIELFSKGGQIETKRIDLYELNTIKLNP